MSRTGARGTGRGSVATVSLVVAALSVGVIVGLASPRGSTDDAAPTTTDANGTQLAADLATRDEWVAALADAAVSGRLEGMRVALLVTDGTDPAAVDEVEAALAAGGAVVVTTARLGSEWWDPAKSSFRGELANQVADTVEGADGRGATDVLEHAIVQAMVPGALPVGTTDPDANTDPDSAGGIDRQAVLLEVLARAEVVTIDQPADEGVEAFVIVSGGGPVGAGAAINAAASVWETYVGTTLVVFARQAEGGAVSVEDVLAETIASGADTPEPTRPSIVAMSSESLATAQVVMALVEQASGGTGVYGEAADFDLIAIP
jgi:hypothetical protein